MGPDEIQLNENAEKPRTEYFTEQAVNEILDITEFKRKTDEAYFRNFVEGMHKAASFGKGQYVVRGGDVRSSQRLNAFLLKLEETGYEIMSSEDGFIAINW